MEHSPTFWSLEGFPKDWLCLSPFRAPGSRGMNADAWDWREKSRTCGTQKTFTTIVGGKAGSPASFARGNETVGHVAAIQTSGELPRRLFSVCLTKGAAVIGTLCPRG